MPEDFPMLDGPPVPWRMAELVYEVYRHIYGRGQSLERIAELGGFSYDEVKCLMLKRHEAIKKGRWKGP